MQGLQSSYCSKCSLECSLEWSHLDECKDSTCDDCQVPQVQIFLRIKFMFVYKGRNILMFQTTNYIQTTDESEAQF